MRPERNNTFLSLLILLSIQILPPALYAEEFALEKLWQLDELSNPESVVYDAKTDVLYVSNINGDSFEKDNNGFISKVSLQGQLIDKFWITGLNAPKGLALYDGRLFVADIDTLVEIDTGSGKISNRYADAQAKFFNDVTVADDGSVYVADSITNTIHQLQNGKFTRWLASAKLRSPNGLLAEPDRILVTAWGTGEGSEAIPGQVLAVSMQDKSISILGNHLTQGNLDGIENFAGRDYLITEWTLGKLLMLKHSGEVNTLLSLEQGMADLDYVPAKKLLLLPMLKTSKLIAYKIHRQ